MNAVIAVTLLMLMLVQCFFFGVLVARARTTLNVHAPAMTGDERFERLVRVHLNTQERLVMMLPLLAAAAHFWSPLWVALPACCLWWGALSTERLRPAARRMHARQRHDRDCDRPVLGGHCGWVGEVGDLSCWVAGGQVLPVAQTEDDAIARIGWRQLIDRRAGDALIRAHRSERLAMISTMRAWPA